MLLWNILNAFKNFFLISINQLIKYYKNPEAKSNFPICILFPHIPVPQLEGGLSDFIPKTYVTLYMMIVSGDLLLSLNKA